jgi:hypothetical protein
VLAKKTYLNKEMKVFLYNEIELQNNRHDLSIGDICFTTLEGGVSATIIEGTFFMRLKEGLLDANEKVECEQLFDTGHGIIFSHDTLSQRFGDIEILEQLSFIFSPAWKIFIKELIRILSYAEDRINIDSFYQLLSSPTTQIAIALPTTTSTSDIDVTKEEKVEYEKEKEEPISMSSSNNLKPDISVPGSYVFYHYLDGKAQAFWMERYPQMRTIRELYLLIKKKHRNSFSKALKNFDKDHPGASVYKKKE